MDGEVLTNGALVQPGGRVLCWRSVRSTPKHYACTEKFAHFGPCTLLYQPGFWRRVADVFAGERS